MIMLALLATASAQSWYDADDFVLADDNGVTWTLTRYSVPEVQPSDLIDEGEDTWCRFTVRVREDRRDLEFISCPEALAERVEASVADWSGFWSGQPQYVGLFKLALQLEVQEDGNVIPWLVVNHEQSESLADAPQEAVRRVSELEVRRQVQPPYPKAAKGNPPTETECEARMQIDTRGRPSSVDITGCDPLFHPSLEQTLMKWRFAPLMVDGEAQATEFTYSVSYRLK